MELLTVGCSSTLATIRATLHVLQAIHFTLHLNQIL